MSFKILTSYFYQIRFFKPNYIPLSTAVFDPKWFHKNLGNTYQYFDKNNVLNGLRAEPFVPNKDCEGLCRGPSVCITEDPTTCEFLSTYYNQLKQLNFNSIMERFSRLAAQYKAAKNLSNDIIFVLIFHETPNNPCSERWMVQKWFKENGYELEEFNKEAI